MIMEEYEIPVIEDLILSKNKDDVYIGYKMLKSDVFKFCKEADLLLNKISLFDKIKYYSDVCSELNIKELTIEDFMFLPESERTKSFNYHRLQNIISLFSNKWKPNWNNHNEKKWFPVFECTSSGWVFSRSAYYSYYSVGLVGFYPSEEISNFCGKLFLNIYKEIL